jgi:hypothetical protein
VCSRVTVVDAQRVAFHIYSSSDVFEAVYTSDYDKVEALYQRLLFFSHAALRSVLRYTKVLRADSTWPDTLEYAVSGLEAGDQTPTVLEYGDEVVANSESIDGAMVLAHLTDKTAELQLASRRKPKSGIGALRTGIKRVNGRESMAGSPVACNSAFRRTASVNFGRTASSGAFSRTGSAATAATSRGAVGSEHGVENWFESATFHYALQASSELPGMSCHLSHVPLPAGGRARDVCRAKSWEGLRQTWNVSDPRHSHSPPPLGPRSVMSCSWLVGPSHCSPSPRLASWPRPGSLCRVR